MSFTQIVNAILPPDDDPAAVRRWRSIIGIIVLALFVHAVISWHVFAHQADIERLSQQIEAKSGEIEEVRKRVDRGTELQLIQLTRSLYDQQCKAESRRDKESLQRMIDRYEQEYRSLTRSQMPSPGVTC